MVILAYITAFLFGVGTFYTINGIYVFIYSVYWCHRGSDYYQEPTPSPRNCLEGGNARPYNSDPLSQVAIIPRGTLNKWIY